MLRIVQSSHAGGAKRYFREALLRDDYYVRDRPAEPAEPEEPGFWGGQGAQRLGLAGSVQRDAFQRLCDNQRPDGSGQLTIRQKAYRRIGYDFNFHCPKSVSVLYALTGDPALRDAFGHAVTATMQELEAQARARVRVQGAQGDRLTGSLVWATFIHQTARPIDGIPDPHLHAHCFTFNATFDPVENRWKAGEFGTIKQNASVYEAAFHARLAAGVSAAGYRVERRGKVWEVAAVPEASLSKFSRRTAEIEAVAARRGITDPRQKDQLGARTRKSKRHAQPWAVVVQHWRQRLTPAEAYALQHAKANGHLPPRPTVREAVDRALAVAFERSAVVNERQVIAHALRYGLGSVTTTEVRRELERPEILRRQQAGTTFLSTAAALEQEKRLLAYARAGRGTGPPLCRDTPAIPAIGLSPAQQALLRQTLGSPDRVTLVRSVEPAAVHTAHAALAASGRPLLVLAGRPKPASASTSRPPRETLATFLADPELQRRAQNGVLWIEGASSIGIASLANLFDAAEKQAARIILSAARSRPSGTDRYDLLRQLETQAGLRSAAIQQGRRLRQEQRTAVAALQQGRAADGLAKLDRLGAVREVPPAELPAAIAAEYARAARAKKTAQVVSPTDADRLTGAIRDRLRELGLLGRSRNFEQLTNLGLSEKQRQNAACYERGQVVVFYKPAKGFRAGQRYEVLGRDPFGNVLARQIPRDKTLLPAHMPWVEALPLGQSDRFNVFQRSTIALAKGDQIRITHPGRTHNERFGHEKLLSKRGQAIRVANLKLLGLTVPDRRYRVPADAVHKITGFTLTGHIKLANGWVLPKNFGYLEYGYCVHQLAAQERPPARLIVAAQAGMTPLGVGAVLKAADRPLESVTVFTEDKAALRAASPRAADRATDPPSHAGDLERAWRAAHERTKFRERER